MMQRLRHPIRSITEPFGKAGLTVAILALVLATTGAAFAAAGLSSKQKKEVTKIAKKYAGKPGANGTNGVPGAPGKEGPEGKQGAPGKDGANGQTGFTSSLPSGKTETGVWAFGIEPTGRIEVGEEEFVPTLQDTSVPISFPIPLAAGLKEGHAIVLAHGEEGTVHQAECPGAYTEPKAAAGYLCVYTHVLLTTMLPGGEAIHDPERPLSEGGGFAGKSGTAGKSGAVLLFRNEEEAYGSGTWAVTAE